MLSHLILPMAGAGTRFGRRGESRPKPLIRLHGRPFFYWAVQSVLQSVPVADIAFAVLQEHIDRFDIDKEIRDCYPSARIVTIPRVLDGAASTCLAAIEGVDDDLPVIFNDCDHAFGCKAFGEYMQANERCDFDGALLTFKDSCGAYSYVRRDADGRVVGTAEKEAVSTDAICGAYVFRNAETFRQALAGRVEEGEPYVSQLYNSLCRQGKRVLSFPVEWHCDFGTPERMADAESSSSYALFQNLEV